MDISKSPKDGTVFYVIWSLAYTLKQVTRKSKEWIYVEDGWGGKGRRKGRGEGRLRQGGGGKGEGQGGGRESDNFISS